MNDVLFYFFGAFFGIMLFEPLIINFIYFTNIDLFLDIILSHKKRDKLIKHILDNYYIDDYGHIVFRRYK